MTEEQAQTEHRKMPENSAIDTRRDADWLVNSLVQQQKESHRGTAPPQEPQEPIAPTK